MQEIVHCYASQSASSRVIPFLPRVEEVVGRFAILEKGNCNLLTQNNPCYFRFSFFILLNLLFRPFVFPHGYSGFFSIIFYYFYIYYFIIYYFVRTIFIYISVSNQVYKYVFVLRINLIIGNNLFSEIFHRL